MAKKRHPAHESLMHGGLTEPHRGEEPIHRSLARGAFAKAAQKYRNGEIGDAEFHGHIKQAHSRLQEPMSMPMAMPVKVVSERSTKGRKGRSRHV